MLPPPLLLTCALLVTSSHSEGLRADRLGAAGPTRRRCHSAAALCGCGRGPIAPSSARGGSRSWIHLTICVPPIRSAVVRELEQLWWPSSSSPHPLSISPPFYPAPFLFFSPLLSLHLLYFLAIEMASTKICIYTAAANNNPPPPQKKQKNNTDWRLPSRLYFYIDRCVCAC